MKTTTLFKSYKTFVTECLGRATQKLPVFAGMTCPVRDGSKGKGGCTFCNGSSFVPAYCKGAISITEQLERGKAFFERKKKRNTDGAYLAYFQSHTNTYCDVSKASRMFDEALSVEGVDGLVISTRPDCLPDEWICCLSDYASRTFVMVELGVESFDDEVLCFINRSHKVSDSVSAIRSLADVGIPVEIHLVMGLPHERKGYVIAMARRVSRLPVASVKLHQLQIVKGSAMARQYSVAPSQFRLYDVSSYVRDVCDFVQSLRADIALDRFVSEMPVKDVIAPRWGLKPDDVQRMVIDEMKRRGTCQGIDFHSI